jgi:hypothetical protein
MLFTQTNKRQTILCRTKYGYANQTEIRICKVFDGRTEPLKLKIIIENHMKGFVQ